MPDTDLSVGEERRRFEALYDAHAPAVLAYALRRTDRATADDVVSEVFLVVWRRLADVPAESERLWLLGTARRVLANERRGDARRSALRDQLVHDRPRLAHEPIAGEGAADGAVLRALAALREPDREALLLVAWDGLPPREAARVLGVAAPTFTMRLSRARKRFAAALDAPPEAAAHPTRSPIEVPDA